MKSNLLVKLCSKYKILFEFIVSVISSLLVLLLVVIAIPLLVLSPSIIDQFKKTPNITKDLPANYEEGEKVFKERVKNEFVLGNSEDSMILRLKNEGFTIDPSDYVNNPNQHMAVFKRNDFICETEWRVIWSSNDQGEIFTVDGDYGASCV